jgi:TetR/AcrR family transcriptional regulator
MVENMRRDPRKTRQELIEAAAAIFSRQGYDGARTQAIADRAGVNKAMINYHFGGKAGLYEAVVGHLVDEVRPRLAGLREDQDPPAAERFRRLIEVMGDAFRRRPELAAIILREHLAGGARLSREVMGRHLGEFFATTRAIVVRGVARGELRPVDPHALHLSLVGALVFFIASEPFRANAARADELPAPAPEFADYLDHLHHLILDGLAPARDARFPRRES